MGDHNFHVFLVMKQNRWSLQDLNSVLPTDRGFSLERNCVLRRWESETLK